MNLTAAGDIKGRFMLRNGAGTLQAGQNVGSAASPISLGLSRGGWTVVAGWDPTTSDVVRAYASGVYDSAEIVRRCERDAAFREICGEHAPTAAKSLSRFRRENRGLLKWSLVQLFKKAIKVRHGDPFLPAGLKSRLLDAAVTRLDLGRQMDRGSEGL